MIEWIQHALRDKTTVGITAAVIVTLVMMLAGYGLLALMSGARVLAQRDAETPKPNSEALQGTREAFLQVGQPTSTPFPQQAQAETDDKPLDEVVPIATATALPGPIINAAPVSAQQPTPIPFTEAESDDDGLTDIPDDVPTIYDGWAGDVDVTIADPDYLADGRWAEVLVTVANISVEPGIPTGYTYLQNNEGGGWRLVSLFRAAHFDVPQVKGDDAPLWWATVRFTDASEWQFPVGCLYIEVLHAEGWEPIYDSEDGYNWEVHEAGGWFDCGNSHDKIPDQQFLAPGEAATVPLYIYLQHPRDWLDEGPPNRRIARIDLEVQRWDDGAPLGIVAGWPR